MYLKEASFIELLNKHQNIIHKVSGIYMDKSEDKEDLFQEIVLQAWKSFETFKGNSLFSTWLYRLSLNVAITFFKKSRKKVDYTMTDAVIKQETEAINPLEEQIKAMYKAIGQLSKIDKALVMLYLEDYNYGEIADFLGITANNVAVKMNRIKIKLKEESQKHYQF